VDPPIPEGLLFEFKAPLLPEEGKYSQSPFDFATFDKHSVSLPPARQNKAVRSVDSECVELLKHSPRRSRLFARRLTHRESHCGTRVLDLQNNGYVS
jgi:hypothetical protein